MKKRSINRKLKKALLLVLSLAIMSTAVETLGFDENDILFFASFDKGFDADIAKGDSKAALNGKPELCKGKIGKALVYENQKSGLSYLLEKNINPSQGTIAFWIGSENWTGDNGDVFQYYFSTHGASDKIVIEHVWYRKGVNFLIFKGNVPVGGFPAALIESLVNTYDTKAIDVTDRVSPEIWYHVVFTWKEGQISSYLNGKPYGVFKDPGLSIKKLGDIFALGFPPYQAPVYFDILCDEQALPQLEKPWKTKIDEFTILRKSLFPSQVQKIFELGSLAYARQGEADVSEITVSNFPFLGFVKASVFPGPDAKIIGRIDVSIFEKNKKTPLLTGEVKLEDSGEGVAKINTSNLPDGEYVAKALIYGKDGILVSASNAACFTIKRQMAWWNNKVGLGKAVPAPWTVMSLEDGSISCWGRNYEFGKYPFPVQIISQKEKLLARPITLNAKSGNNELHPQWDEAHFPLVEEGAIKRKQKGKLGKVDIEIETLIEYDGFAITDITLDAESKVSLDSLYLEIPLNKKAALFLVSTDLKFKGFAPEHAVKFSDHCVWAGNDNVGLHWMCENYKGWNLSNINSAIEFIPKQDAAVLRINFINKPTEISKPLVLRFMYEATPVKMRPEDWRKNRFLCDGINTLNKKKNPYNANIYFQQSCGWPAFSYSSTPGPDSKLKTWKEYRTLAEKEKQGYIADFLKNNGITYMPYTNLFARGTKYRTKPNALVPEYTYYFDEWKQVPGRSADGERRDGSVAAWATVCPNSKLYRDYWTWQVANVIMGKGGLNIDGLYYDIFRPGLCKHMEHGCGWVDNTGKIQGTMPIINSRKLMKRIYTAVKKEKPEMMMMGHCSSHVNMAFAGFVDIVLDGEQFRGSRFIARSGHYSDSLTNDWMRSVFTGRQYGFVPAQCSEVGHFVEGKGKIYKDCSDKGKITPETDAEAFSLRKYMDPSNEWFAYNYYRGTRELLAILLLHDSLMSGQQEDDLAFFEAWNSHDRFGLQEKDVEFTGYWESGDEIKCNNEKVKVSSYVRPGKRIMLVISNLTPEEQKLEIEINPEKFGLPDDDLIAVNGESAGELSPLPCFDGRKLKISLRDYDYANIIIGTRSSMIDVMNPLKR